MNGHQKQREQSCQMIEDALFSLMKEKEYSRITVSELARRADVARRTFYRLYKGKEDVLQHYFMKLSRDYSAEYPALQYYDIRQIARDYFCFWYRYKDLLLLIHKCGIDELLYDEISRASAEVISGRIGGSAHKTGDAITYWADFSTGGFIMLLRRWISEGMTEAPGQYASHVSETLLKFIRPANM